MGADINLGVCLPRLTMVVTYGPAIYIRVRSPLQIHSTHSVPEQRWYSFIINIKDSKTNRLAVTYEPFKNTHFFYFNYFIMTFTDDQESV